MEVRDRERHADSATTPAASAVPEVLDMPDVTELFESKDAERPPEPDR